MGFKKDENEAATNIKAFCAKHDCTITVEYSGYGDSGEIFDITSDKDDLDLEEIERDFYDLLPPGWEINDGSEGSITATADEINIHHGWKEPNYEDYKF